MTCTDRGRCDNGRMAPYQPGQGAASGPMKAGPLAIPYVGGIASHPLNRVPIEGAVRFDAVEA